MFPPTLTRDRDPRPLVAFCAHCAAQRLAESSLAGGPGLEIVREVGVLSGCCHDCGAGFCCCNGVLRCELCPRQNSPVIVRELYLYRVVVPEPLPTLQALGETPIPRGD